MSDYHARLIKLVKANAADVPEKLSEMIVKARAGAGGAATAAKRAAAKMTMSEHRFFVEIGPDGLSEWLQIMPGPGRWDHPKYGTMSITSETLDNYVANYNNKVYQEHIPIDAEHKTKLSGALAYYREMKVGGPKNEPGIWAKLEMTERGSELLEKGGFKYFSPEMYDEWEDPATGKTHTDVITGGAFTTRPFFKESSLKPVTLSELTFHGDGLGMEDDDDETEEGMDALSDAIQDMVVDGLTDAEITASVKAAVAFARTVQTAYERCAMDAGPAMATEVTPAAPAVDKGKEIKMTEETKEAGAATTAANSHTHTLANDPAQFAELTASNAVLSKQFAEEQARNKQLAEKVEAMETEAQTRRFTEIVAGKGGSGDGAPMFFGEPAKHVAMLSKLAKTFGEESPEVADYVEMQRAAATALATSAAMAPIGDRKQEAGSAAEGVTAEIKAYAEANKLDNDNATREWLAKNPSRYTEYDREFKANAKK